MSLTDDWKAGKLAPTLYYVKYKDGRVGRALLIETPDYYGFYNNCDLNDDVAEVLARVPSYEELQKLKDDNKRMAYDLGNQGYRIKNQRHEINNRLNEIQSLRELLKECYNKFARYQVEGAELTYQENVEICDKISAAIGESEE